MTKAFAKEIELAARKEKSDGPRQVVGMDTQNDLPEQAGQPNRHSLTPSKGNHSQPQVASFPSLCHPPSIFPTNGYQSAGGLDAGAFEGFGRLDLNQPLPQANAWPLEHSTEPSEFTTTAVSHQTALESPLGNSLQGTADTPSKPNSNRTRADA
jgi:hypothetical protein